jgi:hypothetical protein
VPGARQPTSQLKPTLANGGDMKIDIDQHDELGLKEIYSGVLLETSEGNQVGLCMRDDTIEMNICPNGIDSGNWWKVNMQTGVVEKQMANQPLELTAKNRRNSA